MEDSLSCQTSPIVGLRFSLHPMADNFVEIIKGALLKADTTNVWMHTDDVSTVIRGKEIHVFDVAKAIILHATQSGTHVAFNGTFSIGCTGDTADAVYLEKDNQLLNEPNVKDMQQYVSSQFSLYPMNNPDYMSVIYKEIDRAKEHGVFNEQMPYASGLHGDIHNVFSFLEASFLSARSAEHQHLVMTVNISINSPSHNKDNKQATKIELHSNIYLNLRNAPQSNIGGHFFMNKNSLALLTFGHVSLTFLSNVNND